MKAIRKIKMITSSVIIFTAVFSGCNKDNLLKPESETGANKKDRATISYSGDGKFDLLGCGYDISERYADPSSGRSQVIDVEKLYLNNTLNIFQDLTARTNYEYHFANNAEDYSRKLTQDYSMSLGNFATNALFKGEITANFSSTDSFSSKFAYADISYVIKQKRFAFTVLNATLRTNYLTQKFKDDLNSMSVSQIVHYYGTHVLIDVTLGGKLDLRYRSETSSSNKAEAVKAGISVNALFKVFGMKANIDYNTNLVSSNFNQSLSYQTVGGDASKGLIGTVQLDNSTPSLNVGNWQSGVDPDHVALIKIGPSGLVPLWEFVEDATKRSALESYINQYLLDRQVSMFYEPYPVHAYYGAWDSDHYYTLTKEVNENPYWLYLGIHFYAFKEQKTGTVPVYQFYRDGFSDHVYSLSSNYGSGSGWNNEGVAFYAYANNQGGTFPVYEFYNPNGTDHAYSTSPNYVNQYPGWQKHGVVFYVPDVI